MTKPITVYWMCNEDESIRAVAPEKASKRFYSHDVRSDDSGSLIAVNYCPASNRALKNLYAIKSIYDYSFTIKGDRCESPMYDQAFFDKHVVIRSIEKKVFSFKNVYAFFTDEKSLEITAHEYPIFEDNEVAKRCIPIMGKYDIGKWFRPLEFPFILKEEFDTFTVKEQDVLYYLRFHTDRPIIFKQVMITNALKSMLDHSTAVHAHKTRTFKTLENFYSLFKGKNYLLKELNRNLL